LSSTDRLCITVKKPSSSIHSSFPARPVAMACALLLAAPMALAQAQAGTPTTVAGSPTLKEVVVSGSRSERERDEVPARVDVLTGDDMDPASVQDIRDLARELPNISVKRAAQRFSAVSPGGTGRDGNAGFNVRGLEGNRVLLTVDGIRVPRELTSGVFGSAAFGRDYHDLGLISRVEIVRGAHSALYGSDGLAGMVAMTTTGPEQLLAPGQRFGGRVGLTLDSEDSTRALGATLAGAPSETVQWLGSVQAGRSRALDNQGRNTAMDASRTAPNPQEDRNLSVLGKLVLTPEAGEKHTLTLEHVDKSSEVEGYTARSTVMGFQTLDLDGTSDMVRTRLSWDGRFAVRSAWADELRATLGHQRSESQETTREQRLALATRARSERSRDVSYSEDLWQGVLQAEKTTPLGANWTARTVYGLDMSVAELDNLVTGTAPPTYERYPLKRFPPTRETTSAVFVQSEWANEQWSVIPALRYDRFELDPEASSLYPLQAASLSDSALSPKLGVIFRPAPAWSVFGNVAAGFRAPSPLQLNNYFENPFGNYRSIPNPDLKPETSRTVELGTRGEAGVLHWEAAVFRGRYKDFIEDLVQVAGTGRPGDPIQFQSVNRGQVRLNGWELQGGVKLGRQTELRLGYGRTRGTDTITERPLNSVNPAKFVLALDHRVGAWKLGGVITHVARKSTEDIDFSQNAQQFATPAHTTLDLKAVWQMRKGLRLSAALRNVSDRTYWEWTNVRGIAANSAVLDSYTAPGRNLAVALVADF
jgi:hemoglobin/transferrin/lactoferrin receptor protein